MALQGYNVIKNYEMLNKPVLLAVARGFCVENKVFEEKIVPQFDKSLVCFFTGNRPHKLPWGDDESDERCEAIKKKIEEAILALYGEGKRLFVCGMAKGGDLYFAEAVLALKERGYALELECAVPCPEQTKGWRESERARYDRVLEKADYITLVSPHYSKYCMHKRNRYMADKSSAVVALSYGSSGGTEATVRYAESKKLQIIRIN